jgi:hypothetical protein
MRYVPLFFGAALLCASIVSACGTSFSDDSTASSTVDASADGTAEGPHAPGSKPIATECSEGNECSSGFCVDGVCCESACDGVCEACNRLGAVGRCAAIPDGQDPDKECTSRAPQAEDAGAGSDAGDAGPVVNPPDQELSRDNAACAGSCNGDRACTFPDEKATCGSSYCNTDTEVGRASCDGNGHCSATAIEACSAYTCSASGGAPECGTSCASQADCQSTHYCSAQSRCEPKKANGTGCGLATECTSGNCVGTPGASVCCNSACSGAGFSCTSAGNVGNCVCPACPTGSCQLFYEDADGDGYGNRDGSVANGKAVYGCKDAPPPGFVANNDDCYDVANTTGPLVKPGQTQYFKTGYGPTNSFDYNCDGKEVGQRPVRVGGTCRFCSASVGSCSTPTTCSTASQQASHGCVYGVDAIGKPGCTPYPTGAFREAVACGQSAPYFICGKCSAAGQPPTAATSKTEIQPCR